MMFMQKSNLSVQEIRLIDTNATYLIIKPIVERYPMV